MTKIALNGKLAYALLSLLLVASLSALAYAAWPKRQSTPQSTINNQDSGTNNAQPSSNINISQVDKIRAIESRAAPAGWSSYSSDRADLRLSAPENWKIKQAMNVTGSEDPGEVNISLTTEGNNNSCGIRSINDAFANTIDKYEKTDRDDPGTIDPSLNVIWHDIKESDQFALSGNQAVRYVVTVRNAAVKDVYTKNVYFIAAEEANKTYEFTCRGGKLATPEMMDTLVQYIAFK
ncbi:hypothetical protein JNJ66_06360 [Candidatus Saccharibacteria bacterium]|nr:hypothetical protein [Candidatus Saccharibacteria bacterium]